MISAVLKYLNNWFERDRLPGRFVIANHTISLPFLKVGQYFRIVGSDLNDGVYLYPCTTLYNEEFTGEVWPLAIPRDVISLTYEIEQWIEDNQGALDSPYASESFGGYSYTLSAKSGSQTAAGTVSDGWKGHFASQLRDWMKL